MERTHTCGDLSSKDIGSDVVLNGWVWSRRDHGGVIFIDLRDRYGVSQIVFEPSFVNFAQAEGLRREYVVSVRGTVRARPVGMTNPKLSTGEVEVAVTHLDILNTSEVPPFEIDDRIEVNEDLRLKYRFLDLRKPQVQHNLMTRSKMVSVIRSFMDAQGFLDIETPFLTKSTPEGARDFLVPSRVHPGEFFALPQSPQIFKQILMVSGFDKYYQIVRCFRDEDLRADRQPEFTQLDIELSFATEERVYALMEGLMQRVFSEVLGVDVQTPFLRMSYDEAMRRFGSDKPDLRFEMELLDVDNIVKKSEFSVFTSQESVQCLYLPQDLPRKEIDSLITWAQRQGAGGLAWMRVKDSVLEGSIVKYFSAEVQQELLSFTSAKNGLLFFIADRKKKTLDLLGRLRLELADRCNLRAGGFKFLWVNDFPLFAYSEDEQRFVSVHHPFTTPNLEDMEFLESDPGRVRSHGYDLVLNGTELAGGSIRIHRRDVQEKVFKALGISDEEAAVKFGFLISALSYGAPPHGGIALGVDRFAALLTGNSSIREVIAFPKTKNAECLLSSAPSKVYPAQLKELHLKLDLVQKDEYR